MSTKKESATIVGVGAAACAVCCAGPIAARAPRIGLGTAAGLALFGAVALLMGAALSALVVTRRRRRAVACASSEASEPVTVALTASRRAP